MKFNLPRRIPVSILFHLAVVLFCIGFTDYYIRHNTPTAITITQPPALVTANEITMNDLLVADLAQKIPHRSQQRSNTEDSKIIAILKQAYKHLSYNDAKEISHSVRRYSTNVISNSLLLGLIATESGFIKNATSTHGAVGLTQVIPRYHYSKIKGRSLHDANTSIEVGSHILKECLNSKGGNIRLALGCYNGATTSENIDRYYNAVMKHKRKFDVLLANKGKS